MSVLCNLRSPHSLSTFKHALLFLISFWGPLCKKRHQVVFRQTSKGLLFTQMGSHSRPAIQFHLGWTSFRNLSSTSSVCHQQFKKSQALYRTKLLPAATHLAVCAILSVYQIKSENYLTSLPVALSLPLEMEIFKFNKFYSFQVYFFISHFLANITQEGGSSAFVGEYFQQWIRPHLVLRQDNVFRILDCDEQLSSAFTCVQVQLGHSLNILS